MDTSTLASLNQARNAERERANRWEKKYMDSLEDSRQEFTEDAKTTFAKFSDNLYKLNLLKYNAQFYANLRNLTLGLIIIALLLKMRLISPFISYVFVGTIAVIMAIYVWSSFNYQDNIRDGITFNDFVAN